MYSGILDRKSEMSMNITTSPIKILNKLSGKDPFILK